MWGEGIGNLANCLLTSSSIVLTTLKSPHKQHFTFMEHHNEFRLALCKLGRWGWYSWVLEKHHWAKTGEMRLALNTTFLLTSKGVLHKFLHSLTLTLSNTLSCALPYTGPLGRAWAIAGAVRIYGSVAFPSPYHEFPLFFFSSLKTKMPREYLQVCLRSWKSNGT